MAAFCGLDDLAPVIDKAKKTLETRSEQISFIHQTLLALRNILDVEENNVLATSRNARAAQALSGKEDVEAPCSRPDGKLLKASSESAFSYSSTTTSHGVGMSRGDAEAPHGKPDEEAKRHPTDVGMLGDDARKSPWRQDKQHPSCIIHLLRQRQGLDALSSLVDAGKTPSTWNDLVLKDVGLVKKGGSESTAETSPGPALCAAVASLEGLCFQEWKWISELETSDNGEIQDAQSSKAEENGGIDTRPSKRSKDPFITDCYVVGKESRSFALLQLKDIQESCRKLSEMEEEAGKSVRDTMQLYLETDRGKDVVENCLFGRIFGDSLDACIWRIEEGLRGLEESISQLLGELRDLGCERWIKAIEDNREVLVEPRWVKKLMEIGLECLPQQAAAVETKTYARLVKVISQCFAALPLPLQCTLFQWLWEQPKGPDLFKCTPVINVQQELTLVFNRLVTGSTDGQLIEIARELCVLAIHDPHTTLHRALHEAVANAEAGVMILKALQCIPFLLQLEVEDRPCFLGELHGFIGNLGNRELSSTEEINLLKIVDQLMKPYRSPNHPDLPAVFPPLVTPGKMAKNCVWPFLQPACGYRQTSFHLQTVLRILDLVLMNSTRESMDLGGVFEPSVALSALLCLLCLIQDIDVDGGGDDQHVSKELVIGLVQKFADIVLEAECVADGVEWLLQQTSHLDWTVRMRVNALFMDSEPVCSKNISKMVTEITDSFSKCNTIDGSSNTAEPVRLYTIWSCTMVAFFQACRISSKVTDLLIKNLPASILCDTSSARKDFYRSACVALGQILPQSSSSEWLTILDTLGRLLDGGLLHVNYTTRFLSTLPMVNLTVYRSQLSLCQILTSVIQLLGSVCISESLSILSWQQVIKNYARVMKVVLEKTQTVASSSPSSSSDPCAMIILYSQFFCHSCEVAQSVPAGESDQLFVWCLELLMRLEELVSGCLDNVGLSSHGNGGGSSHGNENIGNHGNEGVVYRGNERTALLGDIVCQEVETLNQVVLNLANEEQRTTLQHKLNALPLRLK